MREQLTSLLLEAVRSALGDTPFEGDLASKVRLAPAKNREHGDFASNVALALAKPLGLEPRAFAAQIVAELGNGGGILERVDIASPGFINFVLADERWHDWIDRALREGEEFGLSDGGGGERVQVEFVSANPTGPLTIGHGRNAVLGDAIARILRASGYEVTREYYFNDAGRQMRVLAGSLRARYAQLCGRAEELPEEGYQGEYLIDIARSLHAEVGDSWLEETEEKFKQRAQAAIFDEIRATLERLGIEFESYFNENTLYTDGLVEAALEDLRELGLVYESEGATWLRSTDLKLDRDRVLVKSSGEPTYLLPDIAYHREKFRRGFQRMVDIFGPDHIEQFPYVQAAVSALGHERDRVEVAIYQWVNLRRGGEIVKMSTRKASFVTIDEVLDEVGSDVFRFFMIERRADTHLDFDLDLAQERSDRNPVFKIQYAHTRLCSIERRAAEEGFEQAQAGGAELARLESPAEKELAVELGRYPERIARAAREREPQVIARYLLDLASAFHTYISDARNHRVLSEDRALSEARLALVRAIRITLANGLNLLGISAPEQM